MDNAEEALDTVGKRIKALRKKMGYSQDDVGTRIGATRQSISKWESDLARPHMENLIELSRLFGVALSYFDLSEKAKEASSAEKAQYGHAEKAQDAKPATTTTFNYYITIQKQNNTARWTIASLVMDVIFILFTFATVCVGFIVFPGIDGIQTINTAGIDESVFYGFVAISIILLLIEITIVIFTVKKYKCKQRLT